MKSDERMLVTFSGTRSDFNRVREIARQNRDREIDLVHFAGINWHSNADFPQNMLLELYRSERNIARCYVSDADALGAFLRERASYRFQIHCEHCQLSINLAWAYLVKKMGYKEVIYCDPDIFLSLYRIPCELMLDDFEAVKWDYPILDYGLTSESDCICSRTRQWSMEEVLTESEMIRFCNEIIASNALKSLTVREAEIFPF